MSLDNTRELREEFDRRKRDRSASDLRKVLSLAEGRRLLWGFLSTSGVFASSFTGNSTTFFNEGRRDMGLVLLKQIMVVKPEAFTQMQREAASEAEAEAKLLKDIDA